MRRRVGDIDTAEEAQGTELHEEKAEEILSQITLVRVAPPETVADAISHFKKVIGKALHDRITLENPEGAILFASVVPTLRLWGKPDRADCTNGVWPVIIERKTKELLPRDPWPDDRVQLGVYMLGMERLGFQPQYGFMEYLLRPPQTGTRQFKVHLNENLKQEVSSSAACLRRVLQGEEEPRPNSPRKCKSCEYREKGCEWKPAKQAA